VSAAGWTAAGLGSQAGRSFVITGANSGIGLAAARALARAGAHVVLAVRDPEKGRAAAAGLPGAVEVRTLDLADLASVRAFASRWTDDLDVLVNNAGVMAVPEGRTRDGFETQIGTNHLGHFALTGLLLEKLASRPEPRVVTVASQAHRMGRIRFDDLQSERSYRKWAAYGQSKLANLLFTYELARRAEAAGSPLKAYAAHPGYSATNLQLRGPQMESSSVGERASALLNKVIAQSDEMGALPTLFAATTPELPTGTYVGPDGPGEMRGHPRPTDSNARSKDRDTAVRLWEASEALTGVGFSFGRAPVGA